MNDVDQMRKYAEILNESVDLNELVSPLEYDEFTRAYMEAMLWAESDDNGDSFSSNYDVTDFSEEALATIRTDCAHFQEAANLSTIDETDMQDVEVMAGHDFWLTRVGHGSGFWDGDWPESLGAELTELSEKFGEQYIYAGDDGELYIQ